MYTFTDGVDKRGLPIKEYHYHIDENDEVIGILYGHFAPFTGENGHGRMLKALEKIGAQKFIIATPDTKDKIDEDRCIFTTEQRKNICQKALDFLGYEGIAVSISPRDMPRMMARLGRLACDKFGPNVRPVFCFGPDREDIASFLANFEDPENTDKLEYIIDYERGTSGTKVRQLIKDGNLEAAAAETHYPIEFIQELSNIWQRNKKELDRPQDDGMSGKHSLSHLWNDGKSTQMKADEFINLINYLDTKANGLISKENFNISEKIDGSSSFAGVDSDGLFFTKFGYSSKARAEEDLPPKYKSLFALLKSSGVEDVLESWRTKLNAEEIKVQLENVWPDASRNSGEYVRIVLVPYLRSKIGKGLIVTIQALVDKQEVPESDAIMKDVQECLSKTGVNARGTIDLDFDPIDLKEDIAEIKNYINQVEESLGKKIEEIVANKRTKDAKEVISVIANYQKALQDKILSKFPDGQFGNYYEGLVIKSIDGMIFKATSDKFKELMEDNKNSMKHRLFERIVDDGNKIIGWSSSKTPDLFEFYLNNELKFGGTAGSCYGFAVYLVSEPPYSEDTRIGYSAEKRDNLYGTNIFKFEIDSSRVMIFTYQEFLKTKLGKMSNASFDDYIKIQCDYMGLELTDEELEFIHPSPEAENDPLYPTSGAARNFYKVMSRHYYQGRRGNLRTPCDGLEYVGRLDGKTLVIWNNHRLVPLEYSNDNGKTWKETDKSDPRYIEYLKKAGLDDPNSHLDAHKKSIFDGNHTPEKEDIYRALMRFSSNDYEGSHGMSEGIFFNIVLHDDKTIDAEFRSNLPQIDGGKHYFRMRKNDESGCINHILEKGWTFNKLTCGLKIGAETAQSIDKVYSLEDDIPDEVWPRIFTEGLKLVNAHLNHDSMKKILCEFEKHELSLAGCMIEEDCFDGWDIHLSNSKPSYCDDPDLYADLCDKYDWASEIIQGHPETPEEKAAKKIAKKLETLQKKVDDAKTDKSKQKAIEALEAFKLENGIK